MDDKINKVASLMKLREVGRITPWEDILVGREYHLPPLVYNKRMDFIVVEKTENTIRIRKIGDDYCQTMFKGDATSNFIVKKFYCNGS